MRTNKELVSLLLDHFNKDRFDGLCSCAFHMRLLNIISFVEYKSLKLTIDLAKPKWYNFHRMMIFQFSAPRFYWKPYAKKPRIKWLKKQIKQLTNE